MSKKNRVKKYQKFETLCKESITCPYFSTCPTCNNRICNSSSKCCKKCTDSIMCPMKGMK